MAKESVSIRMKCSKCEKEAVGLNGHIGKYHKKCSGRKSGELRAQYSGKWQRA
jgi:hypothetical protein